MTTRLDSQQIHLWLTFCDAITDTGVLARYRDLLSEQERSQADRFHATRDRHRHLVSRALLRTTLSRYADIPPEGWTFATNSHGKPAVDNDDPRARRISFNISHTGNLIVLGVCADRALGVDTEDTHARTRLLEIAERHFAPAETADLRALPVAQRPLRFFRYWTLKEAYIKARGMGLSIPLERFAFDLRHSQRIDLAMQPALQDAPRNWAFWQFYVASQHIVAVCVQRQNDDPPSLPAPILRDVIPLVSEATVPDAQIACRWSSRP